VTPSHSSVARVVLESDRMESRIGQVVVDSSVAERGPENSSTSAEPFAVHGTM
jgi:hypothetical protein